MSRQTLPFQFVIVFRGHEYARHFLDEGLYGIQVMGVVLLGSY